MKERASELRINGNDELAGIIRMYKTALMIPRAGKSWAPRRSFVASLLSQAITRISEDDVFVLFLSEHICCLGLVLFVASTLFSFLGTLCLQFCILGGLVSLFFIRHLGVNGLVTMSFEI